MASYFSSAVYTAWRTLAFDGSPATAQITQILLLRIHENTGQEGSTAVSDHWPLLLQATMTYLPLLEKYPPILKSINVLLLLLLWQDCTRISTFHLLENFEFIA